MAQAGGSYNNPLKKFKYAIRPQARVLEGRAALT